MKSSILFFVFSIFLFLTTTHIFSQSITINLNNYQSYCAGSIIEVPVSFTGNFANSNFRLKLTSKNYGSSPDSTFYVQASNSVSPLRFQLPKLYGKINSTGIYTYDLAVEATQPTIISNTVIIRMFFLPQVQLLVALNSQGYTFPRDEYMNPNIGKYIAVDFYQGVDDNSLRFKLNDSLTYSGLIHVNPPSTFTYKIAKVWNSCGVGRILGSNAETVKVNPFKIKITTALPTLICEDKKVKIKFDYVGKFNSNNQFFIDLTNARGDTLTTLTTTTEDSSTVYAMLPNNLPAAYYRVRVRGTSPDAASSYYQIKVLPKPVIELSWDYVPEPVTYNFPISVRLSVLGSSNIELVKPTIVKFSDGSVFKDYVFFNGINNGFLPNIKFNLKPNIFYTIDSLVTRCGVLKDFTVIGARSWNVKNDFYTQPLPKRIYCEGEQIKFKVKSSFTFGQNNVFTLNLYNTYKTLIATLPVSIIGDSLVATLPPYNLNGSNDGMTFTVTSSQPQNTTSYNWDYFTINKKPEFRLSNYTSSTISTPSVISIQGFVKGINPLSITVNNGVEDRVYKFYNYAQGNEERVGTVNVFAGKSQNLNIQKIENVCGNVTFNPPITYPVTVTNPYSKYMVFTNSNELINLCLGYSYLAKFDTVGQFSSSNVFIITLKVNGIDYEIGRGNRSPISITLPSNLPFNSNVSLSGSITLSSSTVNLTDQQNVERFFNTTITSSHIVKFSNVEVNGISQAQQLSPTNRIINILKDDKVNLYLSSNQAIGFRYKINDKWFSQVSGDPYPINITISKDTMLILEEIGSVCGTNLVRDTLIVKVKKYRVQYSLALTSEFETTNVCQGDNLEVFFGIEGENPNRPTDYKMYLTVNDNLLEMPIVTKKIGSYIVKIPDFPYDGFYRITILPNTQSADFATSFFTPKIYINRKVNIKLTGMDGSDIGWYDDNATWAYLKASQVNAQVSSWWAKLEEINLHRTDNISYQSPIITVSKNDISFKIKDVETICGYGLGIGQVTMKKCYNSLDLPNYYVVDTKEVYSRGYIKLFSNYLLVSPQYKTLLSPKTFSDMLPGFEIKGKDTQSFTIEQKGCVVTN